jgi:NAD-dependent dihydropyrimidine dehydrogenase PreA subunit
MKFSNDKERLTKLADMMNDQMHGETFLTDELLHAMDASINPEEIDFLIKMGNGGKPLSNVKSAVDLPEELFEKRFQSLIHKGYIIEHLSSEGMPEFHLMSIIPGFWEMYLMRSDITPAHLEFSRRVTILYESLRKMGDSDFINQVMRDMGATRSIALANTDAEKTRVLSVNKTIEKSGSAVLSPNSVLEIFNRLEPDETIAVSRCFCRHHRKLVGEPCRHNIPEESCIYMGPVADHLVKHGFGRKVTKTQVLEIIKTAEAQGVVHLIDRFAPLKDVDPKYQIDVICNCCPDCCGVIGSYRRGDLPIVLKSYYRATIFQPDRCTGCGTCIEKCPVKAIAMSSEEIAEINADLCCGCGMCNLHCPDEVIRMTPDEREAFLPILEKNSI